MITSLVHRSCEDRRLTLSSALIPAWLAVKNASTDPNERSQLNCVKRRTSHELSGLSLVRVM